jgi:hypothetical protein
LAHPYESARGRATLATIFLFANLVATVIGIAFDFVEISFGAANPTDNHALIAGLAALVFLVAYLGTFIPAIVFFCMWVHRVVRNMPALGALDPRWSPAGAVWRCFIPFLNLAHPMSGTLDAWRGSDPARRWINVTDRKAIAVPVLIIGWWACWLIGRVVSTVASRLTNGSDPRTVLVGYWIDVPASLMLIAGAVLAVLVVREATARQDRKNDLIASGQLA